MQLRRWNELPGVMMNQGSQKILQYNKKKTDVT